MRCRVALWSLLFCLQLSSQEAGVYSVQLTDKPVSVEAHEPSLSSRSLARRAKQQIALDHSDLPVNSEYVRSIKEQGIKVKGKSKWFNALLVQVENENEYAFLEALPFVSELKLLQSSISKNQGKAGDSKFADEETLFDYGSATEQIEMLNGSYLHFNGYTGQDMIIAIMDAGFSEADNMQAFREVYASQRLVDWVNYVDFNDQVFQSSTHGTRVFSIIGGVLHTDTSDYTGTAPGAKFCLYNTEAPDTETPVEEFNWLLAAERADSIGADVLSTSLGYTEFDDPLDNYTYADMDGNTALITRAADMAAKKGMIVVNSAGNSGNNAWTHIVAPADGDSVLAVGAINIDLALAGFSSRGPSSDGQVKPDVVALGQGTALLNQTDALAFQNGTSFSCPIISGFAACLWQAVPEKTNMEIVQAIRESAHQYNAPDSLQGYGIPDFAKAYNILTGKSAVFESETIRFRLFPNPSAAQVYLGISSESPGTLELSVFNSQGVEEFYTTANVEGRGIHTIRLDVLSEIPSGIYFVRCTFEGVQRTFPLVRL